MSTPTSRKTEYGDKQYAFVFHPNKNWVEPDIVFIEAVIYTSLKSKLLKQGTWVDVVSEICSGFSKSHNKVIQNVDSLYCDFLAVENHGINLRSGDMNFIDMLLKLLVVNVNLNQTIFRIIMAMTFRWCYVLHENKCMPVYKYHYRPFSHQFQHKWCDIFREPMCDAPHNVLGKTQLFG